MMKFRNGFAVLCVCSMLAAAAACNDEPADGGPSRPDGDRDGGEPAEGIRLEGQLAPGGGLSMSDSMTLSGHLSPAAPATTSTSASFRLELAPVSVRLEGQAGED